jgi:hypothetical protein
MKGGRALATVLNKTKQNKKFMTGSILLYGRHESDASLADSPSKLI